MTLEQIIEFVDNQIGINNDAIDQEASRHVKIFTEIQKLYMWNTRKLEQLSIEADKVKMFRTRFYSGKLPGEYYKKEPLREAILKTDIDQYVKVDNVYIEARTRLSEQERIVKYLEDAKKQLSDRTYLLNTALSFQRMNLGM
jgi:hypothetical protein